MAKVVACRYCKVSLSVDDNGIIHGGRSRMKFTDEYDPVGGSEYACDACADANPIC